MKRPTHTLIKHALIATLCVFVTLSHAAASTTKPYPKDTCIVTDNKLGSMGTPVRKVYQGQEVKFCCKPCVKKFEKDPARYLAKLK